MTTCSIGPSLWKPSTKASQLFTQRNTEAAEEREAEGNREREEGKQARAKERNRLKKWSSGESEGRREKKAGRWRIRSSWRHNGKTGRRKDERGFDKEKMEKEGMRPQL